jgi:hypothetical protein
MEVNFLFLESKPLHMRSSSAPFLIFCLLKLIKSNRFLDDLMISFHNILGEPILRMPQCNGSLLSTSLVKGSIREGAAVVFHEPLICLDTKRSILIN